MNLFALFFLFGVTSALKFNGLAWYWCLGAAVALLFALSRQPHFQRPGPHTALIGITAGLFLGSMAMDRAVLRVLPEELDGVDLLISGAVSGVPENQGYRLRFDFLPEKLELAELGGAQELPDRWVEQLGSYRFRISWYNTRQIVRAGQRWRFRVRLKRPASLLNPGGFDYAGWLFTQGIQATGYVRKSPLNAYLGANSAPLSTVRLNLAEQLQAHSPKLKHTGLMQGLLVGIRHNIPDSTWSVLRATGTSHLLAISGLHVGLAAGFGMILGAWCWRGLLICGYSGPINRGDFAGAVSLLSASTYAALAGFTLPTQRALLMLGVLVVLRWYRVHPVTLLPLSIACIGVLVFDPLAPLSPGFWLSFFAVLVLLLRSNRLSASENFLLKSFRLHVCLALLLMPLTIGFFGEASLISPLANLLAIPWVSLITVPVLLLWFILQSLFDSSFLPLLVIADQSLQMLLEFLGVMSDLKAASVKLATQTAWSLTLVLAGLALLCSPRGFLPRIYALPLLLPLLLGNLTPRLPAGLRITVLDVGQGLSVVVRTRHRTLVFDTGGRLTRDMTMARAVLIPYLQSVGIRRIDRLLLSHADSDHIAGAVDLIEAIPTGGVTGSFPEDPVTEPCLAGDRWVWDDVEFTVLHPAKQNELDAPRSLRNNNSCTVLISYGEAQVLLPGDLEAEGEQAVVDRLTEGNPELAWIQQPVPLSLMIAPHHGSDTSSTPIFLDTFNPEAVVYSVGRKNMFGFPHETVQMRYKLQCAGQFRTDRDGALTFDFDRSGEITRLSRYGCSIHRPWQTGCDEALPINTAGSQRCLTDE